MKAVREQLKKRFMKVFRLYRHKKYGEPLEPPKLNNSALNDSN